MPSLIFIIITITLGGLFGLSRAETYATPKEGPVNFHRHRLLLEEFRLKEASRAIAELAPHFPTNQPEGRRGAVQALALALALNPGNDEARNDLKTLTEKAEELPVDPSELPEALESIREIQSWLTESAAGQDAEALSDYLSDLTNTLDPNQSEEPHPDLWVGWIPPTSAFQPKPKPSITAKTPSDPSNQVSAPPKLQSRNGQMDVFLWHQDPDSRLWFKRREPLSFKVQNLDPSDDGPRPLNLRFSVDEHQVLEPAKLTALTTLRRQNAELPVNVELRFSAKGLRNSLTSQRPHHLTAAVTLLAASAIDGKSLQGTVLGDVDEEGNLLLYEGFWNDLNALVKNPSHGRIVLPAAADPLLPELLALERYEFFIEHEVLLAAHVSDAATLLAKETPWDDAFQVFAMVKEHRGRKNLGTYCANRQVRQRLAAVSKGLPAHASARYLSILGAGQRPYQITNQTLSYELLRALDPIVQLKQESQSSLSTRQVKSLDVIHEQSRKNIDALDRYASSDGKQLIDHARALANELRSISRSYARGDKDKNFTSTNEEQLYRALVAKIDGTLVLLTAANSN